MNKVMSTFVVVLLLHVAPSYALGEGPDCSPVDMVSLAVMDLSSSVEAVTSSMYKDVFDLKVNMDGEGKLSILFERGQPKLLKLTYKNKSGTVVKQITFDDLAKGRSLDYENSSVPGKAISFSKDSNFQSGNHYKFKLSYRNGMRPERYQTQNLELVLNGPSATVLNNNHVVHKMILSPGVSFFSWDGTFKKLEFR